MHRLDIGGQFISYRKLQQWQNAIACQIQKCSTTQELQQLWHAIEFDCKEFYLQYNDSVLPFLQRIWLKRFNNLQPVPPGSAQTTFQPSNTMGEKR